MEGSKEVKNTFIVKVFDILLIMAVAAAVFFVIVFSIYTLGYWSAIVCLILLLATLIFYYQHCNKSVPIIAKLLRRTYQKTKRQMDLNQVKVVSSLDDKVVRLGKVSRWGLIRLNILHLFLLIFDNVDNSLDILVDKDKPFGLVIDDDDRADKVKKQYLKEYRTVHIEKKNKVISYSVTGLIFTIAILMVVGFGISFIAPGGSVVSADDSCTGVNEPFLSKPCCSGLTDTASAMSYDDNCNIVETGTVCINKGDGVCGLGENICNSPDDCYVPVCGNGICDTGEDATNCSSDCGGGGSECILVKYGRNTSDTHGFVVYSMPNLSKVGDLEMSAIPYMDTWWVSNYSVDIKPNHFYIAPKGVLIKYNYSGNELQRISIPTDKSGEDIAVDETNNVLYWLNNTLLYKIDLGSSTIVRQTNAGSYGNSGNGLFLYNNKVYVVLEHSISAYTLGLDPTSSDLPFDPGGGALRDLAYYNGKWYLSYYSSPDNKINVYDSGGGLINTYDFSGVPPSTWGNRTVGHFGVRTGSNACSIAGSTASVCGNGSCEAGEHASNCPADCSVAKTCSELGGSVCSSNKVCSKSVVVSSDTSKCCTGICEVPVVCGNGTCESGETESSCPADCGPSCVIPDNLPSDLMVIGGATYNLCPDDNYGAIQIGNGFGCNDSDVTLNCNGADIGTVNIDLGTSCNNVVMSHCNVGSGVAVTLGTGSVTLDNNTVSGNIDVSIGSEVSDGILGLDENTISSISAYRGEINATYNTITSAVGVTLASTQINDNFAEVNTCDQISQDGVISTCNTTNAGNVCGNGTCETDKGETENNCPEDCDTRQSCNDLGLETCTTNETCIGDVSTDEFGDECCSECKNNNAIKMKYGDLVSYWKMGELSGQNRLDYVSDNNLRIYSNPGASLGYAPDCLKGGCLDVVNRYIWGEAIPSSSSLWPYDSFAVSAWVKFDSRPNNVDILAQGGILGGAVRENPVWSISYREGRLNFTVGYVEKTSADVNITVGDWHHLVAMFYSGKQYIYFDGFKIGGDSSAILRSTIGMPRFVGGFFDGAIDEVGFWKNITFASDSERDNFVDALTANGSAGGYDDLFFELKSNGDTCTDNSDCVSSYCNDGVCANPPVTCNALSGDICSADQYCSTGFISASDSEQCCLGSCMTLGVCGDGTVNVDLGEECDDGNDISNDGCDNTCHISVDCSGSCDDAEVPSDFCTGGEVVAERDECGCITDYNCQEIVQCGLCEAPIVPTCSDNEKAVLVRDECGCQYGECLDACYADSECGNGICLNGACEERVKLNAVAGDEKVNLTWSDVGQFRTIINRSICQNESGQNTRIVDGERIFGGSEFEYLDVGLDNGTRYCYGAFAQKYSSGVLSYLSPSLVQATPYCLAAGVSNLVLDSLDDGVNLSWINPPGWDVIKLVRTGNGDKVITEVNSENFLDANVINGLDYTYSLIVINGDCRSESVSDSILYIDPNNGDKNNNNDGEHSKNDNIDNNLDNVSKDVNLPDNHNFLKGLSVEFDYTLSDGTVLYPNNGLITALRDSVVEVEVPGDSSYNGLVDFYVTIDENSYLLKYDNTRNVYSTTIDRFVDPGVFRINQVVASATDELSWPVYINVLDKGKVSVVSADGEDVTNEVNVELEVYVAGEIIDTIAMDENNEYAEFVDNGDYQLNVLVDSEAIQTLDLSVEGGVINSDINITLAGENEKPIIEIKPSDNNPTEEVLAMVSNETKGDPVKSTKSTAVNKKIENGIVKSLFKYWPPWLGGSMMMFGVLIALIILISLIFALLIRHEGN